MATVAAGQQYALYDYSAGNATFALSGTYTGTLPKDYVVQVTSTTDGTFANTRYRWSDTDGVTWNQSNLTPVSGTPVSLSNGVSLTFTLSSLAPEFVNGDEWDFRALRPYGWLYALDGSRNNEYRSGALPASSTLRIGLYTGSTIQPSALIVEDHNLAVSSSATVTLFAHPTTLFTETGGFSQAVTWRSGRLTEVISSSAFPHWWLRVVVGTGALTYLRLSECFLGNGVTFTQPPIIGNTEHSEFLISPDATRTLVNGVGPQIRTAKQRQYTWQAAKQDAASDGGRLDAAFTYATEQVTYKQPPFWYIPLDSDLSTVQMNAWAGGIQRSHRFLDRWDYDVQWIEVIRQVAP